MSAQRVGAAVDIGSNSVHLLVARVGPAGLEPLRDESALLGLGDVVDQEGEVPAAAEAELAAALGRYVRLALREGAATTSLVATEPLRRAANGAAVAAALGTRLGVPVHVLSEQQEGELTYLGVTGALRSPQSHLVVDIGGGSSEVVLAEPGRAPQVTSLPTGSSRLSAGLLNHDPPTPAELDGLVHAARSAVAVLPAARPARATFVGGTATNLARIAPLQRDGLGLAYRVLGQLSASQLGLRFGVNLRRARQLPAGAALVDALLDYYRLDAAEVSQASLRDGAIIASARLGERWPEMLSGFLATLATGEPPAAGGRS